MLFLWSGTLLPILHLAKSSLILRSQFRRPFPTPQIWVRSPSRCSRPPVFPLIALIKPHHSSSLECQLLEGSDSSVFFLVLFLLPIRPDTWQVLSKYLLTKWRKQRREEKKGTRERTAFEGTGWSVHCNSVICLSDVICFYTEVVLWHSVLFLLVNYKDYVIWFSWAMTKQTTRSRARQQQREQ